MKEIITTRFGRYSILLVGSQLIFMDWRKTPDELGSWCHGHTDVRHTCPTDTSMSTGNHTTWVSEPRKLEVT